VASSRSSSSAEARTKSKRIIRRPRVTAPKRSKVPASVPSVPAPVVPIVAVGANPGSKRIDDRDLFGDATLLNSLQRSLVATVIDVDDFRACMCMCMYVLCFLSYKQNVLCSLGQGSDANSIRC
jgi:hypothetical protein